MQLTSSAPLLERRGSGPMRAYPLEVNVAYSCPEDGLAAPAVGCVNAENTNCPKERERKF
jgi:hypothetical protein